MLVAGRNIIGRVDPRCDKVHNKPSLVKLSHRDLGEKPVHLLLTQRSQFERPARAPSGGRAECSGPLGRARSRSDLNEAHWCSVLSYDSFDSCILVFHNFPVFGLCLT